MAGPIIEAVKERIDDGDEGMLDRVGEGNIIDETRERVEERKQNLRESVPGNGITPRAAAKARKKEGNEFR